MNDFRILALRGSFSPNYRAHHFASLHSFEDLLDSALAVAFPTECALCGAELSSRGWLRICRSCWASLAARGRARSAHAAACPLRPPTRWIHAVGECGACRAGEPAFDGARSFGLYSGKLRQVVLRLKFGGDERLGWRLGELLAPPGTPCPAAREFVPTPDRSRSVASIAAAGARLQPIGIAGRGLVRALARQNVARARRRWSQRACVANAPRLRRPG